MDASKSFIAYKTIVLKEIVRFLTVWKQTLLAPIITTSLYFLIFGAFIGSQIANIEGFTYMQFIVPGLIMMPLITSSFSHVVFSVYMARFTRTIDDILVSPVSNTVLVSALLTGGLIRGIVVSTVVAIVSLLFSPLKIANIWIVLAFILVTAILFGLFGLIVGLYSRTFDDTALIPTFVLTPLIYLGGVFYSINALPEIWQTISKFNPLLYIINGFRYGFLGITDVTVWVSFVVIIIFIILLGFIAMRLIKKGVGLRT